MNHAVLIVDDSPILRRMIRKVVTLAGINPANIHEAGNGREALELLARTPIDLILLDLHMPEMDGESFLAERARDASLALIPVAIVSTECNAETLERLRTLGACASLRKPFEPEDLSRLIGRVLKEAA
ncbi:MAG: response regulator [Phycisphaerales bacterium JB037]